MLHGAVFVMNRWPVRRSNKMRLQDALNQATIAVDYVHTIGQQVTDKGRE